MCLALQIAALQLPDTPAERLLEPLLILCNRQQQLEGPFKTLLAAFSQAASAAADDTRESAGSSDSGSATQQWWQLMRIAGARLHVSYVEQLAEAMPNAAVTQAGECNLIEV